MKAMLAFFQAAMAAFSKIDHPAGFFYRGVDVLGPLGDVFIVAESGDGNESSPGFATQMFAWPEGKARLRAAMVAGVLELLLEGQPPAFRNTLSDMADLTSRLGIEPSSLSTHQRWVEFLTQ